MIVNLCSKNYSDGNIDKENVGMKVLWKMTSFWFILYEDR